MSLLATQRNFRDRILDDQIEAPSPAALPAPGLAVYRHAYRAQLVACLRDTFEKTWSWLGDEAFDAAALRHVADHPPSSWTLGDYGVDFDRSLAALYPDDPEVAELAWLDWALRRAFDGPDAEPIEPSGLAEVDWDCAVLHFVPTLVLGDVTTNSAAIWRAIDDGETPPPADRLPGQAAIRVWRLGLSPRFCSIDAFEKRALTLALEGTPFARLCDAMVEGDDEADAAAERIGALLGSWLQDGLVCSIG